MHFTFKFSLILLFMALPAVLLVADYAQHTLTRADTESATEQAGLYAMKQGVVPGSLRDTNVTTEPDGDETNKYRTQIAVDVDPDLVEEGFDGSSNSRIHGSLVNLAEQSEERGISNNPPMLAIRSNTVNNAVGFRSVASILPNQSQEYVIQNEKVIILEMKETE
ncbi:hypothetical protein [Salibacterium aidingense]|uniref:hypothetical protein n=1 Tax=Salibacterium aidingense TaxID=384933 RepID=UPI00047D52E1|nr:hypothetical protein [Salibacterium aidingense]